MNPVKLPPPTVAGTIAPFYEDLSKGTVTLTVPFTMNKIVSLYEVYGFSVRIKDAETNTPFGTIASTEWTQTVENPSVTFELGSRTNKESLASKLNVGRYYKLQLAYQDEAGNDGYYSTICIIGLKL